MSISNTSKGRHILAFFVRWFLLFLVFAVGIGFGIAEPLFFKSGNLLEVMRSSVTLSIMATGLCFVFSVGEIDFAAGLEMSLGAVCIGKIMDIPAFANFYILAVLLVLGIMAFVGFVNSVLVVRIGIPAFIATLGMSTMLSGICKYLTGGGNFISRNWPPSFTAIGQRFTFGVIPNPIWVLLGCALIAYMLLSKTKYGRFLYAVGANASASAHVGINVQRTKALGFMLCSMFIGMAGIVSSSTIRMVSPTMGSESMLGAISALMLGATFLRPGVFNIPGAVLGGILLAIISNGLIMINASYWLKDVVQASILLLSVGFISFLGTGLKVKTL
ncbi:MAG: ABC transporter permease [Clostridiales bacterium]|nr:ABC transporter permease [Clostridiales bacterium]